MRSATYLFTRSQVEASLMAEPGRAHRDELLPCEDVARRLRDLFLLLDPHGTGLVSREAVLARLFRNTEVDSWLPWRTAPHRCSCCHDDRKHRIHQTRWDGEEPRATASEDSLVMSGVCVGWTAAPTHVDFCGLLQLCSCCLGAALSSPSYAFPPAAALACAEEAEKEHCGHRSFFTRLRHATRSVRIDMSDAEVLRLVATFRALDEEQKGYLDVADVARGLAALTAHALQRQAVQKRRACGPAAEALPEEPSGANGLMAVLTSLTRAGLLARRGEHTIFLEMAQKMILTAALALQEVAGESEGQQDEADGAAPSATPRTPASLAGKAAAHRACSTVAALQRRFAQIEHAEAQQTIPLVVSLPQFIRSYQCRTGAFPPQFLRFTESDNGCDRDEDAKAFEQQSQLRSTGPTAAPVSVLTGDAGDGESNKENQVMRGPISQAQLLLPHQAVGPDSKTAALTCQSHTVLLAKATLSTIDHVAVATSDEDDSVMSGRRSMSGGAGGPPITTVSPFEVAFLNHLLTQYAEQLCPAPAASDVGERQTAAPPPMHAARQEMPDAVTPACGAEATKRAPPSARKYVPHIVTSPIRDFSLLAAYAPSDSGDDNEEEEEEEEEEGYNSTDTWGGSTDITLNPAAHEGVAGEPEPVNPSPSVCVDETQRAQLNRPTRSPLSDSAAPRTSAFPIASSAVPTVPRWPETAARGVPLVPLQELERHLLLNLGPVYTHLEEVRWALVQRVCEVARMRATLMHEGCEVVNVAGVVEAISANPACLGLALETREQRLRACLEVVASSLPRAAVALVVELMMELRVHRPPLPAEGQRSSDDSVGAAALFAVAAFQRRLPAVLAGCLDVCDAAREGIARLFTSCAEPCLVQQGDVACCYLSMETLLTRLLAAGHFAAPPPHCPSLSVGRRDGPQLATCPRRRLSQLETAQLSAAAADFVDARGLLNAGDASASVPFPSYAEHPMLCRDLFQHLLHTCPELCASRLFLGEAVAAQAVSALLSVRKRQVVMHAILQNRTGQEHVVAGWERTKFRQLIFAAGEGEGEREEEETTATSATWRGWAEYAVGRAFCAVGPEGCRQLSLALCQLPLWREPGHGPSQPDGPAQRQAVLVQEEALVAAVAQVLVRLRPDWTEPSVASGRCERGDASDGCHRHSHRHHVLWDIVGSCPRHKTPPHGRAAVVDMRHLLRHFLEAFPVLSAASLLAPPQSLREPPRGAPPLLLDVFCHMTDVQSLYFALKRLAADDEPRHRRDTAAQPRHPPRHPHHHIGTRSGEWERAEGQTSLSPPLPMNTSSFIPIVTHPATPATSSRTSNTANHPEGRRGDRELLSPSPSRPLPVPFDRLKAILEADGLLFVLCVLGSQNALTGELTQLAHVLQALSLTEGCVRVALSRLGRSGGAAAPLLSSTDAHADPSSTHAAVDKDGGVGATLRARAMALAMPASLQHAAVQLYCCCVTPPPSHATPLLRSWQGGPARGEGEGGGGGGGGCLDRHRFGSFVFRLVSMACDGAGPDRAREEAERELVELMNRLFRGSAESSEGGGVPGEWAGCRRADGPPRVATSASSLLSLEDFVAAVFRERSAMLSRRLASRHRGDGTTPSATVCPLDTLCAPFSPLAPQPLIE